MGASAVVASLSTSAEDRRQEGSGPLHPSRAAELSARPRRAALCPSSSRTAWPRGKHAPQRRTAPSAVSSPPSRAAAWQACMAARVLARRAALTAESSSPSRASAWPACMAARAPVPARHLLAPPSQPAAGRQSQPPPRWSGATDQCGLSFAAGLPSTTPPCARRRARGSAAQSCGESRVAHFAASEARARRHGRPPQLCHVAKEKESRRARCS